MDTYLSEGRRRRCVHLCGRKHPRREFFQVCESPFKDQNLSKIKTFVAAPILRWAEELPFSPRKSVQHFLFSSSSSHPPLPRRLFLLRNPPEEFYGKGILPKLKKTESKAEENSNLNQPLESVVNFMILLIAIKRKLILRDEESSLLWSRLCCNGGAFTGGSQEMLTHNVMS